MDDNDFPNVDFDAIDKMVESHQAKQQVPHMQVSMSLHCQLQVSLYLENAAG